MPVISRLPIFFLFAMFLLFLTMGLSHVHMSPLVTDARQMGSEWTAVADKWVRNPALTQYKVDAWAYKLSFLLAPLMILATAATRPGRAYCYEDHAAFALNEMAFLGLLSFVLVLVPIYGEAKLTVALVALFCHSTLHLKGAFQLGWTGAVLRGVLLTIISQVILFIFYYLAAYAAVLL